MKIKTVLLSSIIVSTVTSFSLAGAWVRGEGEIYSKLSLSRFESDQTFQPNGKKIKTADFEDISLSLYAEYGLTSKWTAISSVLLKHQTLDGTSTRTQTGPADAWVYIKRELYNKKFVASVQTGAKIPLGYSNQDIPPLGDGQIDLEGRALVGKSFYPFPGYGSAEWAYRKRNGDFSDTTHTFVELGVNPTKKILFKITYDQSDSSGNDTASEVASGTLGANIFDKEETKISPSIIFSVTKSHAIELYYESVIDGGNAAAGDTIGIGFSWQNY